MTALLFRIRRVRFRITLECCGMVWVLEREGRYSNGPGKHTIRHCRVAPATPEGLTGLIELATRRW